MGGLHGANGCHKNGQMQIQETQRPPEGGWGWMVAFGMALMFVSIASQAISKQTGNQFYVNMCLAIILINCMLAIPLYTYNHLNKHNFHQAQPCIILLNTPFFDQKLIVSRCFNTYS
jgi:heme/copper-type cytochrome/quinol oxidase subunit 3